MLPSNPTENTIPTPSTTWVRLRRNLHTLSVALREMIEERPLADLGNINITPDQLRVLRMLAWNDGPRVGELASALGVKPSSASLTLDRLEKKAFVERYKEGPDRRVTRLRLTESGQEIFQRAETAINNRLDRCLSSFNDEHIEDLTENLDQLIGALVANDKTGANICFHSQTETEESTQQPDRGDPTYRQSA